MNRRFGATVLLWRFFSLRKVNAAGGCPRKDRDALQAPPFITKWCFPITTTPAKPIPRSSGLAADPKR